MDVEALMNLADEIRDALGVDVELREEVHAHLLCFGFETGCTDRAALEVEAKRHLRREWHQLRRHDREAVQGGEDRRPGQVEDTRSARGARIEAAEGELRAVLGQCLGLVADADDRALVLLVMEGWVLGQAATLVQLGLEEARRRYGAALEVLRGAWVAGRSAPAEAGRTVVRLVDPVTRRRERLADAVRAAAAGERVAEERSWVEERVGARHMVRPALRVRGHRDNARRRRRAGVKCPVRLETRRAA